MSAMKHWENKFVELHELHKDNSADSLARFSQAKSELQPIYEKYLTKQERKLGRMASTSFGWPPEFDPDAETIVATQPVNNRKVIIERYGRIQLVF